MQEGGNEGTREGRRGVWEATAQGGRQGDEGHQVGGGTAAEPGDTGREGERKRGKQGDKQGRPQGEEGGEAGGWGEEAWHHLGRGAVAEPIDKRVEAGEGGRGDGRYIIPIPLHETFLP